MKIAHKELLNNKHKETAEPVQILYSQITIIIFIIPKLLTSLKEMLDLTKLWSHEIFLVTSWTEIMASQRIFQNDSILS